MHRKKSIARVNHDCQHLFLHVIFSRFLLIGIFLVCAMSAGAQEKGPRRGSVVIDDTTKQIYGPNTSRYFFEQEVFFNREAPHPIDTLIHNFHHYTFVERNDNLYQDLGIIGSAIHPIYYQSPDVIGVRSGAHVYDMYWNSERIRYYDTRSPYSNMRVILGDNGRSITRATYSRNINPRWNFGFTFRGLFIDKQIQHVKGDRFVRSNYYDGFTTYQTKDSTYRVFFNFRRLFHRADEFGGVRLNADTLSMSDFFDPDAQPWLTTVESNDLRINVHLFHQYSVGRGLQVYHIFDRYRQKNNFLDIKNEVSDQFFDFDETQRDSLRDVTKFKTVRNEMGIKGSIGKIFYNGYYAIRHYSMTYNHFKPDTIPHLTYDSLDIITLGNESYLGGRISFVLDSIGQVNGNIEVMHTGNYRVQGEIKSKWFEARVRQMRYSPGFIEQVYRGAHDVWNNNFANIETTQFNGYLHYRSPVLKVSPGLTFTRIRNYVFYKKITDVDTVQQVLPMQSSGNQVIAMPELRLGITFFKHLTLSGRAIYTKLIENADNAISVPDLFVNAQFSYANIFFGGNFDFQTGVDLHWQSDYYASGYDVAARQFYRQDDFIVPAFPVVDLFLNAKIIRGRVFFKYHNFVQLFTKSGYLTTPFYPGQKNVFDFGFDWSFYD